MNKKIAAAVSAAALTLGATSANAGIIIPAGEWTLDVNGNVNVYATLSDYDTADSTTMYGALAGKKDSLGEDQTQSINTGLLPAWLGFTGTTRQNDLDVSFTISMQPNVSDSTSAYHGDAKQPLWRQAFLTFGDASWGQVKMGKDLGIFAGNAILNDMTLLGVGAGAANSGAATTLGGIGTGYIYPAWKGQITYTTPNFNGFTAKVGITNPNQVVDAGANYQDRFGVEGQLEYAFAAGKVWSSFATYEVTGSATNTYDSNAIDVGVAANFGNAGIVAYLYSGDGAGTTIYGTAAATNGATRDSDGGYIQATYVSPTGTKLGVAYGLSTLDQANSTDTTDSAGTELVDENKRWTVGAYHPLTKHLNLVAEYNNVQSEGHSGTDIESDHISLGAILFF